MPTLFDPIAFGQREAKNRLVMAPMLTTHREIDGFPTPWHVEFYAKRARDGVGAIVVECTATAKDARNSLGELGLYKDEHVEGMRPIASAIRQGGALAFVQIHSAGRVTPAHVSASPLAPSDETLGDGRTARAMTPSQVDAAIEEYVAAIARAKAAGFDGVELHGCHGYLLNQFASPAANRREDRFGGKTIGERLTFAREIISRARAAVGDDFVIGYRMGFNDPDAEAGPDIARELSALSLNYLHVSGGIGPGPMPAAEGDIHGFWLAARAVKAATRLPVIAVNTIHTLGAAKRVVSENLADAAAVARPYLLNADWLTAQREGREPTRCLNCKGGCHYLGDNCPHLKMPS